MTFPSYRDPKKIHFLFAWTICIYQNKYPRTFPRTRRLHETCNPTECCTCYLSPIMPSTCLSKKVWKFRLCKEFTPFKCLGT